MEIGIDLMMKAFHWQKINLNMNRKVVRRRICYFIAKQIVLNDNLLFLKIKF